MKQKTKQEKYQRRCLCNSGHGIQYYYDEEDKERTCHLCGSKHWGRFTKGVGKDGKTLFVCEGCRSALSHVTVYDGESEIAK